MEAGSGAPEPASGDGVGCWGSCGVTGWEVPIRDAVNVADDRFLRIILS